MVLAVALLFGGLAYLLGSNLHPAFGVVLGLVGLYFGAKIGGQLSGREATYPDASHSAVDTTSLGAYRASYRDLNIVGESYRQDAIRHLWNTGADTATFDAVMTPEINNPHDKNAVRVDINGVQVGYLSRETALDYRSYMAEERCRVPVHLIKGGSEGTIGVFTGLSSADKDARTAASKCRK